MDRTENKQEAASAIINEIEEREIATGNASEESEYHDYFEELKDDVRNKRGRDNNLERIR